jgi:hypothetical protein
MVVLADQNITKIYLPIRNYIINQTSRAWVKIGAVKGPTFHMAMKLHLRAQGVTIHHFDSK